MSLYEAAKRMLKEEEALKADFARMQEVGEMAKSSIERAVEPSLFSRVADQFRRDEERTALAHKRWEQAMVVVPKALTLRGWYLSGKEPCTLIPRLAKLVEGDKWDEVDSLLLQHQPGFKVDALESWLRSIGAEDYTIKRVRLFLKHHNDANYEESVAIGVPLLDSVSRLLFDGKDFTRKKGGSKPYMAMKSVKGPNLNTFSSHFVQQIGSLQCDVEDERLDDENYWNRHAIAHGLMKREMGKKDSAKCLMALTFLFFAGQEDDNSKK